MEGITLRHNAALVRITIASLCALALALAGWTATADAKTVNVSEKVSLHLVHKSGTTLVESGTASGTLAGRVSATFVVSAFKVSGSVTIYPSSGGSVTINVVGSPRSVGNTVTFGGTMGVRKGTGTYARATGSGTFTGTVNRRTWAATVNAKAKLSY
ncbi:MAG TPA: autotransporter [Conexibacter sp.]|jgi:hypothetical protein